MHLRPALPSIAVASVDDPSLKGVDFKYIVCTHKAVFADPSVPQQLAPVIGKNTTIVLIQNGVGIEEPFQAMYPNNTVLSGVVGYFHLRVCHAPILMPASPPSADMGQCEPTQDRYHRGEYIRLLRLPCPAY